MSDGDSCVQHKLALHVPQACIDNLLHGHISEGVCPIRFFAYSTILGYDTNTVADEQTIHISKVDVACM